MMVNQSLRWFQKSKQTNNTRLAAFVSKATWVSQHQKGKTILSISGFNEARDDRVAVESAEPYASHLHLTPDI